MEEKRAGRTTPHRAPRLASASLRSACCLVGFPRPEPKPFLSRPHRDLEQTSNLTQTPSPPANTRRGPKSCGLWRTPPGTGEKPEVPRTAGEQVSVLQGGFVARDGELMKTSEGFWLRALLDPGVPADTYHEITLQVWRGKVRSVTGSPEGHHCSSPGPGARWLGLC